MRADCTFRFANQGDVARVVAFVNEAYHGNDSAHGWTPETGLHAGPRTNAKAVAGYVVDPNSRVLLCEGQCGLIGCALIDSHDGDGHLGMFAVNPRLQAAGWGRRILAEAERHAVALWHCRSMTMTVISAQTALIAYYERRGYRRTGERAPFLSTKSRARCAVTMISFSCGKHFR